MGTLKPYLWAFLIAGLVIPVGLHVLGGPTMPWWPDTVSLGIGFGVVAVLLVSKTRTDRETNRRLWKTLQAVRRHFLP